MSLAAPGLAGLLVGKTPRQVSFRAGCRMPLAAEDQGLSKGEAPACQEAMAGCCLLPVLGAWVTQHAVDICRLGSLCGWVGPLGHCVNA